MWLLQGQLQLQTHGLENAPQLHLGFWQAYVTGSCSVCLCLQRQRRIQAPSATAQKGVVENSYQGGLPMTSTASSQVFSWRGTGATFT